MEDKDFKRFRSLVLLFAQLYSSVEMMDIIISDKLIKGATKRKLRMAMEELESNIKPFVNKLYEDEEEMIFQKLQEALTLKVKDVVDSQLEDIVNEYSLKK